MNLNLLSLLISTEVYWLSIHRLEWANGCTHLSGDFFFFLLLEISAEGKSFLLLSFTRNTHGRAPEWCEKVGAVQSDSPVASFPVMGAGNWKPSEAEVVINESVGQRETAWILN